MDEQKYKVTDSEGNSIFFADRAFNPARDQVLAFLKRNTGREYTVYYKNMFPNGRLWLCLALKNL